jgi:RNA polymerase II subunit A-like phosphatase
MALSSDDDDTPPDLLFVPDVKKVMPAMKMRVLSGVTIVFSGVLPLGTDVQNADIAVWAKTFGATITEKVGRGVTHVIAARPGTAKVKQAAKRGSIKIVGTNWLLDSIQQWRKLDERPYSLIGTGPDGARGEDVDGEKIEDNYNPLEESGYPISSDDETTGLETEDEAGQPERKRLKLNTGEGVAKAGEGDDVVDDQSPLTIDQDEWADIDKELKEFMGSDAESDSDTDSVASALSARLGKRKRAIESGEEESEGDGGGRPAAKDRGGTGLRHVANAESERGSSASRTPATDLNGETDDAETRREQPEVDEEQQQQQSDGAEDDESDDELARELEREMESLDEEDDTPDEIGSHHAADGRR